jgi:diacylglycerol kinase (ATP)
LKLLLVFNPSASGGRARRLLPAIRAGLEAFADLKIEVTREPGHARRLVSAANLEGLDGIVAAGGDGTLFEVLNGLYDHPASSHVPLGLIPVGTGNAFARDLGLSSRDWRSGIDLIAAGHKKAFDVGRVQSVDGTFHFLNIVGMGFPVDALRTAKKLRKFGRSAFTLAVLREILRLKSSPLVIEFDGKRAEQENIFVEVSNTRYTGASFLIAPEARPDDGLLDITLLCRLSRWRLLRLFPTIYRGTHLRFPEVSTFQAREVKLIAPAGFPLLPDGEFHGESPATITCLKRDLEIFCPVGGLQQFARPAAECVS